MNFKQRIESEHNINFNKNSIVNTDLYWMLQPLTVIHLLNLDRNVCGLESSLLSLVLLTRLLISLLEQ